jgi:hypothetical protein
LAIGEHGIAWAAVTCGGAADLGEFRAWIIVGIPSGAFIEALAFTRAPVFQGEGMARFQLREHVFLVIRVFEVDPGWQIVPRGFLFFETRGRPVWACVGSVHEDLLDAA